MNSKSKMIGMGIGAFAVLLIIGIAGLVSAAPFWAAGGNQTAVHQQQMEQILETGTYQDLVNARVQDGINYMPFITSESQFVQMQEQHQQMEQYAEQNGIEMPGLGLMQQRGYAYGMGGYGMMGGFGNGYGSGNSEGRGYGNGQDGGCPMWD